MMETSPICIAPARSIWSRVGIIEGGAAAIPW